MDEIMGINRSLLKLFDDMANPIPKWYRRLRTLMFLLMCYLLRLESKEELLLDDRKGDVVETAAVSELLKKRYNDAKKANLTYYRDKNGVEVDIC